MPEYITWLSSGCKSYHLSFGQPRKLVEWAECEPTPHDQTSNVNVST